MLKQMSLCDESNGLKAERGKVGLPLRRSRSATDGLGLELQQELFPALQSKFRPMTPTITGATALKYGALVARFIQIYSIGGYTYRHL